MPSILPADITAEEFVRTRSGRSSNSLLEEFRALLARKLDTSVKNVDVFTVMNHPLLTRTVDVRYAAHGSPYYRPVKLDGIISRDILQVRTLTRHFSK